MKKQGKGREGAGGGGAEGKDSLMEEKDGVCLE